MVLLSLEDCGGLLSVTHRSLAYLQRIQHDRYVAQPIRDPGYSTSKL